VSTEEPFPGLERVLKKEPGLKKWVFKNGDQTCAHPQHTLIFKRPTKEISSAKIPGRCFYHPINLSVIFGVIKKTNVGNWSY